MDKKRYDWADITFSDELQVLLSLDFLCPATERRAPPLPQPFSIFSAKSAKIRFHPNHLPFRDILVCKDEK